MTPQQYCHAKACPPGSTLSYALVFVSAVQREALCALHALRAELCAVADTCAEPALASAKLDWWRDELERLFADQPQHPITRALLDPVRHYDLVAEQFAEIVDGAQMLVGSEVFDTPKTLALYAYRVSGVTELLGAQVLGYADRHTLKYAHALGIALEQLRTLSELAIDARRQRCFIPLSELQRHRLQVNDLVDPAGVARRSTLIAEHIGHTRAALAAATELLPGVDRSRHASGLIRAAIGERILDKIEHRGYGTPPGLVDVHPVRKLWVAWRTRRRLGEHGGSQ